MPSPTSTPARASRVVALFLTVILCGCSTVRHEPASVTPDGAYIAHWPSTGGDKRLRLAVKDLIDMKGVVTSAGSEFLAKNSAPAKRDAKCLAGARRRNVQIVGKTNTTEFAVAVSGINEYYGVPKNPISSRRNLIPGGSSSGSAVAVANGSADVAFGTDTAGSIRIPAACCGVVGLKTTFGLVPLDGVYPIAPNHLDTVGPLARDIAGTAVGMDLLQPGFAARYRSAGLSGRKIRVGRLYLNGTNAKVDRAVDEALAAAEFQVVRMGDDFRNRWVQAQADAATIAAVNAWLYDEKFRNQRDVTLTTKAVIALGQIQYETTYRPALRRQAEWKKVVARALRDVDFIALPTIQNLPPRVPFFGGSVAFEALVLGMQNTAAVNLAGVPALAMPIPIDDRAVPFTSLQLVGPRLSEAALLNAGRVVETALATRRR